MEAWLANLWSNPWAHALAVAVGSFGVAWIVEVALIGVLARVAKRTKTNLDDLLLDLLKRPLYVSLLLFGFDWAVRLLHPGPSVAHAARASLITVAIVLWSFALLRMGRVTMQEIARRARPGSVLQARTLPLFDIISKTAVLAGAIYLGMVAWHIDIGAWLASAGVVGIAVGFAARDSLANYFAGVFIIADAPYKLGDVITLDDGQTRGRVTDIGLRSTRIQTNDEIEINIPNSILGSMKIENRTAGPTTAERIAVEVGVAYGTDVAEVLKALSEVHRGLVGVVEDRGTVVRLLGFGESSLDFKVYVFIEDPMKIDVVRHELHVRIYAALRDASIPIPFPQRDVHLYGVPESPVASPEPT